MHMHLRMRHNDISRLGLDHVVEEEIDGKREQEAERERTGLNRTKSRRLQTDVGTLDDQEGCEGSYSSLRVACAVALCKHGRGEEGVNEHVSDGRLIESPEEPGGGGGQVEEEPVGVAAVKVGEAKEGGLRQRPVPCQCRDRDKEERVASCSGKFRSVASSGQHTTAYVSIRQHMSACLAIVHAALLTYADLNLPKCL